MTTSTTSTLDELRDTWASRWPAALGHWSRFTKLSEPRWCFTEREEKREHLSGSFAMIRLNDQAVVISLRQVQEAGLEDFAEEVLAHEIGHHVFVPGNLLDQGRALARIRRGLPTKEHLAPLVANLYEDLLINDRLQRTAELDIAGVYQKLGGGSADKMWTLYMRIYELLWSLPRGSLATGIHELPQTAPAKAPVPADTSTEPLPPIPPITVGQLEGDAILGARLVRVYARDWLDGAGRFAALCLPYLMEDDGQCMLKLLRRWMDLQGCGT